VLASALIVGALGWVTSGFKAWDANEWLKPNDSDAVGTGNVFDGDGNALASGTVYPLAERMIFASASAASASSWDIITVQATVYPETATDKRVNWSLAWVNPSSNRAASKPVTDFVTVTPDEEWGAMATVMCLGGFGEQIKITVTSVDNPNVSADCILDFARRISSVSLSFGNGIDFSSVPTILLPVTSALITPVITPVYGVGTVDDVYLTEVLVGLTGALLSGAGAFGITAYSEEYNYDYEEYDGYIHNINTSFVNAASGVRFNRLLLSFWFGNAFDKDSIKIWEPAVYTVYPYQNIVGILFGKYNQSQVSAFLGGDGNKLALLQNIQNQGHLMFQVILTGQYSTYEQIFYAYIDVSNLGTSAAGMAIDTASYVF
jgi:hypothetical protein